MSEVHTGPAPQTGAEATELSYDVEYAITNAYARGARGEVESQRDAVRNAVRAQLATLAAKRAAELTKAERERDALLRIDDFVGDRPKRPGRKPSLARYTPGQPVTAEELQAITDSSLTEKAWQAEVVAYLMERGWVVYHTLRSKGSAPGFPDLVCLRPPVVAFIELKREPARGNKAELTIHQTKWIDGLKRCTTVKARVYRPSDRTTFQEDFL